MTDDYALEAVTRPPPHNELVGALVLSVVFATAWYIAALLVTAQLYHTDIFKFQEIGLVRYLDGTADKPFVYRVLSPWLVRLLRAWHLSMPSIPTLQSAVLATCAARKSNLVATCSDLLAYATMAWVFATSLLISTYLLALGIFRQAGWAFVAYIAAALMVNALLLLGYSTIYDFTVPFFATLLFALAVWQRDILFSVALVAAILTKESLFLIVIVYAMIGYGARPTPKVAFSFGMQTLIFIVIYAGERIVFATNDGFAMYHNVIGHVKYIGEKASATALLLLVVFAVLLFYRYPEKPRSLRRSLLILPIMFALYVYGGNPGEFRILLDIFPIVLLPVVHSIRHLTTGRPT
jgi:hypothetical protein